MSTQSHFKITSLLSPSDLLAFQDLLLRPGSADHLAVEYLNRRGIHLHRSSVCRYRNFLQLQYQDTCSPPISTLPPPNLPPAHPTPCTPTLCTPATAPNSSNNDPLPPARTAAQLSSPSETPDLDAEIPPETGPYDSMTRSLSYVQRLLDQKLLDAPSHTPLQEILSLIASLRSLVLSRLKLEELDTLQQQKAKQREKELQAQQPPKDPQFLINQVRTLLGIPLGNPPGGLDEGTGFGSRAEYPPPVTDTYEEYIAKLDRKIAEEKSKKETLRHLQEQIQQLQQHSSPCTPIPCTPQTSPNSSNPDPLPPARTAAQLFSPASDHPNPPSLLSTDPAALATDYSDYPIPGHRPWPTRPDSLPGTDSLPPLTPEQQKELDAQLAHYDEMFSRFKADAKVEAEEDSPPFPIAHAPDKLFPSRKPPPIRHNE